MPSSTASETWSQTLSGWPSVTDSEVSRNERDELKDVVTSADHNLEIPPHLSEGGLVSAFMGRRRTARDGQGGGAQAPLWCREFSGAWPSSRAWSAKTSSSTRSVRRPARRGSGITP